MNKYKIQKIQHVVFIALLAFLIANPIATSVAAGQQTRSIEDRYDPGDQAYLGFDLPRKFAIIYDPYNEDVATTAWGLHDSMSLVYKNTDLVDVNNWRTLNDLIHDNDYWIKMYVFEGGLHNFTIGSSTVSWGTLASTLMALDQSGNHHIFGAGSTDQLRQLIPGNYTNIHIEGSDQISPELVYFYNLWEVSEILLSAKEPYSRVGEDMQILTLQYFGDNFNSLLANTIDPQTPLGEKDQDKIDEEFDTKLKSWNSAYQVLPNGVQVPLTGDGVVPENQLMTLANEENDFTISQLPFFSGLEGPVAGVIDLLLEVLIGEAGSFLNIGEDTADDIINIVGVVLNLISDTTEGGGDVTQTIKGFLGALKNVAPIPEELFGFFDLFVDGIYALRGDTADVINFGKTLITTVFDQVGSLFDIGEIGDIVENIFLDATELGARLVDSESPISDVLAFAMEKLANYSIVNWVEDALGVPANEILATGQRIVDFIVPMINSLVSGDFSDLLNDLPTIITSILENFGGFGLSISDSLSGAIDMVMRVYHVGMQLYDQFTAVKGDVAKLLKQKLNDVLEGLMNAALKAAGVTGDQINNVRTFVNDFISMVDQASTDLVGTLNEMRDRVSPLVDQLETAVAQSIPAGFQDLLDDVLATLTAIMVPTVPLPSGSDLLGLAKSIITEIASQTGSDLTNIINIVEAGINSVFGIIALLKDGGSAQALFLDNVEDLIGDNNALNTLGVDGLTEEGLGVHILPTDTDIAERVKDGFVTFLQSFIQDQVPGDIADQLNDLVEMAMSILVMIAGGETTDIMGVLQTFFLQGVNWFITEKLGIDSTLAMKVIRSIFENIVNVFTIGDGKAFDVSQSLSELKTLIVQALNDAGLGGLVGLAEQGLSFLFNLKDIFTDGIAWIFSQLSGWVAGLLADLIQKLLDKLTSLFEEKDLLNIAGTLGLGLADFLGIEFTYDLRLSLNLDFNKIDFTQWVQDIVFRGIKDLEAPSVGEIFQKLFSFISFTPVFSAELGVGSSSSGKDSFFSFLLESLGVGLEFSGSVKFVLQLLSFSAGGFDTDGFLKVIEWAFAISITISRTFTLFDFLTAGVGGGALAAVAEFLGLDGITITIYFGVALEIVKKAANEGMPAQGSMTVAITLGLAVHLGFDLVIVAISLDGGLEIVLTFFQDLSPGVSAPLVITLDITIWFSATLTFLFWDFSAYFEFHPPGNPYDLSPNRDAADYKDNALGQDRDNDGLPDDLEAEDPTLDPDSPDSDGDGLNDKLELRVSKTDPSKADTDGDGLSDFKEYEITKTDPLNPDTDYDGLNDGEEVELYGTDPFSQDTDEDRLTDYYEVHHAWNMTGITPSVLAVTIGGKDYSDHTDPLNPDTDDDGVIDGEEGEFGPWWGNPDLYNVSSPQTDPNPIIFNGGYTHPLDNDTDDDSYYQIQNGDISGYGTPGQGPTGGWGMTDGAEIAGIPATKLECDDGDPPACEYVPVIYFTSPVNPDTDGDTAKSDPLDQPGVFLNSDGYEIFVVGSDPLDADTDDDGLIDGAEGTLLRNGNHTDVLNPDTDGDGLFDFAEITLGSSPRNADTDNDLVPDGDEFFIYHTSPFLKDTDFDGVDDGWELFFSHSNPHSMDTDNDGLVDYDEIYVYNTDPVDEDSDNDGLTDREELFIYLTDPNDKDTDHDGLRDGEEIEKYNTDPNNWDTDGDAIEYLNEFGEMTWSMSDYEELFVYGTNPLSQDTDNDTLLDSWELYIGSGLIPDFEPIPVDPLNNDTDGDLLLDGSEMLINETFSLINPYVAYIPYFPYLSSPVLYDTDGDGLDDNLEIFAGYRPDSVDTDNDTLSDREEVMFHLTSPLEVDTDGDGIWDGNETSALAIGYFSDPNGVYVGTNFTYDPLYATDPLNEDTDNDGWPDGLELFAEDNDPKYDALNADTDGSGIPDGYERDYDFDGLSDGDEYYTYSSDDANDTGFVNYRNPDSDFDGLLDGEEILLGTKPYRADSDADGYSDPLELTVGTDPMVFTSEAEMLEAMQIFGSPLAMVTPAHKQTYSHGDFTVKMFNLTNIDAAWYRYREIDGDWSDNFTMSFDNPYWENNDESFNSGNYSLQVFGLNNGTLIYNIIEFSIDNNLILGLSPASWGFVASGSVGISAVGYMIRAGRIRIPGRRGV